MVEEKADPNKGTPPFSSFPMIGYCADCFEEAHETPSGPTCKNGHGGCDVLDEIPTCAECSQPLKPNAKFCGECGASTEEKKNVEDVKLCPECSERIAPDAKFCGECGHSLKNEPKAEEAEKTVKMPVKKEEPKAEKAEKVEKTVKMPSKEEEETEEESAPQEDFDFSEIDPSKDWECFGMIEPDHTECKECHYRAKCEEKSAE